MTRLASHTAVLAAAIAALLVLLLAGCTRLQTVTVPAEESSVRSVVPDTVTLQELPPARLGGTRTEPIAVRIIHDTVAATVDLSWLEIDRSDVDDQTVTVRTQADSTTTEQTYQLPAVGEQLRLRADSIGLRGTVFGQPAAYEVEADVRSVERPWWRRAWAMVRLVVAFGGGLVFGYITTKLIPGL